MRRFYLNKLLPRGLMVAGALAVSLGLLSGCTPGQYHTRDVTLLGPLAASSGLHTRRQWRLTEQSTFYVIHSSQPELPAAVDRQLGPQLRRALADHFAWAVAPRQGNVGDTLDSQLQAAASINSHYLVVPALLAASDGFGDLGEARYALARPDRVQLKVLLYDVFTGQLLDVSFMQADSGWLYSDSQLSAPLLYRAFTTYARSLGSSANF